LTQQELGRRSGLSRSFLSQVENTTAAMAGAISGAHRGLAAIPRRLAGRVTDQGSWDFSDLTDLAGKCYDIKHRQPG
jgi:hypothetical protein